MSLGRLTHRPRGKSIFPEMPRSFRGPDNHRTAVELLHRRYGLPDPTRTWFGSVSKSTKSRTLAATLPVRGSFPRKRVNGRRQFSNELHRKDPMDVEAKMEGVDKDFRVDLIEGQLKQLIKDPSSMETFSKLLTSSQRRRLAKLISEQRAHNASTATDAVKEPSARDLRLLILNTSIPFIGFGLMDNAILILAGDAIDHHLGVLLGISTLCAAAIGNIVSDVAGVMLGTAIEDFCGARYLSLPVPHLTTAQRQLRSVRFANQFGCALGLVIGCVIGMFPLLLLDSNRAQVEKMQETLDNIFRHVVSETKELVCAEKIRLHILVQRHRSEDNMTDSKFQNTFSSGWDKSGLIVPTTDGDFLYNKDLSLDGTATGNLAHTPDTSSGPKKDDLVETWIPVGRGIVSQTALTGKVLNIENIEGEDDYHRDISGIDKDFEPRNMLCVPVMDGEGNTIAVLQALNKVNHEKGTVSSFTDRDVNVLQALASHISVSLQELCSEALEKTNGEESSLKQKIQVLKESGFGV